MGVVIASRQGYNYKYADLATLMRYVNEDLRLNVRFVGVQMPDLSQWGQATILCDKEWNALSEPLSPMPVIPVEKKGMDKQQAFFAAVTTAKRYSLMGALGIASTEDEEQLSAGLKRDMQNLDPDSDVKKRVDEILSACDVPPGQESQYISQILGKPVTYRKLTEKQGETFVTAYQEWRRRQHDPETDKTEDE